MSGRDSKQAAAVAEASSRKEIIVSILRMSQKALGCVLAMVAVGYVGGLFAICFKPDLAEALTMYTQPFIPLFQLEIGVYGFGSTLENIQKIKAQVEDLSKEKLNSTCENG